MIIEKTWGEFRASGLLWFVNRLLHIFGWAITFHYDDSPEDTPNEPARVVPCRTKFRGFDEATENKGFCALTNYFIENGEALLAEVDNPENSTMED